MPDLKHLTEKEPNAINQSFPGDFFIVSEGDNEFSFQIEDTCFNVISLKQVFILFADHHFKAGKEFVRYRFRSALND